MSQERQFQLRLEGSVRGPTAILTPKGEDPRTSDNSGFFELTRGGGKIPENSDALQFELHQVLPSDQKDKPVLIDVGLFEMLRSGNVQPTETGELIAVDQGQLACLLAQYVKKLALFSYDQN